MRVVFDNNVLISAALLKNSLPFRAFEKAVMKHIVLRSHALSELNTILSKSKFDKYFNDNISRIDFIIAFIYASENIEVTHSIKICRDLELALSGQADFIVTGDSDLLVLHPFENIEIITPKIFLETSANY